MRAEDVAPRTWLLAAFAGWALLAWILALAGLGGRVAPSANDPSLAQALPQPRPSPPERLGPYAQYGELATRPLFSEDRRPKPFSLRGEGEGEQRNTFDYVLTSVLLTPGLKLAILQPSGDGEARPIRVKLGEAAEEAAGWRLVSLEPRQAVFEGPDGQRTMDLRAFDGTGGQPATPASRPSAARGSAPAPRIITPDQEAANAAQSAANAASDAANAAATASARARKPPANAAPAEPAPPATPDAQIEAIRKRIQARREQLRREAQQAPAPANNE